jgi:hypothetical protein
MSNKIKPHYVAAINGGMALRVLTTGGINSKVVASMSDRISDTTYSINYCNTLLCD